MTTSSVHAATVTEKSFAYTEYRLELSGAPKVGTDRAEHFEPTEMQVTNGRPGPPGRPDRGIEVQVVGPHPSPRRKYERLHRQWVSGTYGDFDLVAAADWVQELAGQVVGDDSEQHAGQVYTAQGNTVPVSAVLRSAECIIGTEWRVDLTDAPDTPGDGLGDFHPTALLVLHSNIGSHGGAFRTTVMLVGIELAESVSSGLGKRWDSGARNGRYAFSSTPHWVKDLVRKHTAIDLGAVAS